MTMEAPVWIAVVFTAVVLARAGLTLYGLAFFTRKLDGEVRNTGLGITAVLLVAWMVAAFGLGFANVYEVTPDITPPPLIAFGAAIPVLLTVTAFLTLKPVREVIEAIPMHWQVWMHAPRATGGLFLVLWAQGRMPGVFALPVGTGDLVMGVAALAVGWLLWRRRANANALAWLFNGIGLADLLLIIPLGILTAPSPIQQLALDHPNTLTTTWPVVLAPSFFVPLGVVMHVVSMAILWRSSAAVVQPVVQHG